MNKIYMYELRRAALSKTYFFSLILVAIYSIFLLKTQLIYGVVDTAPFSQWSFMQYLLTLSPILTAIILIYVSKLCGPGEKGIRSITAAMPFSPALYYFIRLAVFVSLYAIAAAVSILLCFLYYALVFDFYAFHTLISCIILVFMPQLFLILGIGLVLGQVNHNLPLALIALIFVIGAAGISLPYGFDIVGYSLLQTAHKAIPVKGYITFELPPEYIVRCIFFCMIGTVLIIFSGRRYVLQKV